MTTTAPSRSGPRSGRVSRAFQPRLIVRVAAAMLICGMGNSPATADVRPYAQKGTPDDAGLEILQEQPHDLIFFKDEAGGGWAKVYPLPFPGREVPDVPGGGELPISVFDLEDQKFVVNWKDISGFDLWEKRLERETAERIAKRDFVGAYPYLAILLRDFPNRPGLRDLRIQFLLQDAAQRSRNGEIRPAIAMLEELRRYAPEYRPSLIRGELSKQVDLLMRQLVGKQQFDLAQNLLSRLEKTYESDPFKSISDWREKFNNASRVRMKQALEAVEKEDFRTARKLSKEALYYAPDLPGNKEKVRRINRIYPIVRVGTNQTAKTPDPIRIDHWAARRMGRLVYRTMFEIQGPGPAGGEYEFIFGEMDNTATRQEFTLNLQPDKIVPPLDEIRAEYLADVLANRATRSSNDYFAPWASAVDAISILDANSVSFSLRRPNVLPEALLQIPVDGSWFGAPEGTPTGDYRMDVQDAEETRFVLRAEPRTDTQPREIVERRMTSGSEAVSLLLQGEIDVCDQLFPADAFRLEDVDTVRVAQYPLPTVHMLIPCSDHLYINDQTFRRGLLYGINREDILKGELLGNRDLSNTPYEGCKVLSGPFPAGTSVYDELGYAYDNNIKPRRYEPPLAKLLIQLAQNQKDSAAKRRKESWEEAEARREKSIEKRLEKNMEVPPEMYKPIPPPEEDDLTLKPIRLAYPGDNLSRSACEAIATQWRLIGLEVELVELPIGQTFPEAKLIEPAKGEDDDAEPQYEYPADIVYASVAVWEPVIDARRVLGPEGLAASEDQLIGLGLRQLEEAINWKQVSNRLLTLHDTAHTVLPVLPLWQMVESYAYRRELTGTGNRIISLYQNADLWQLETR